MHAYVIFVRRLANGVLLTYVASHPLLVSIFFAENDVSRLMIINCNDGKIMIDDKKKDGK